MFSASPLAVTCLLFLCVARATAAESSISFCESYDKAFEEANERGVPIMIVVIEDDEEANDDIWHNTMLAPEFVSATEHTVNIVGNRGDQDIHGVTEVQVDGRTQRLCKKFHTVACLDHKKAEQGIFRDFARDGVLKTPMFLIVLPDQTIVQQLIDRHPMGAFLDAFKEAEKRLPNGLTHAEAASVRKGLAESKAWLDSGDVAKVIDFALPFQKRKSNAGLIQRVLALLEQVTERGRVEMDAIEARIAKKDYVPAIDELDSMIERYRKSDIEKVAKERRAALAKNREVKEAIAQAKREDAARKTLESADSFMEKGLEDRAKKLYERLLDKFPDTAAATEYKQRG